jgi:AraC-like DNA-binding protein
MLLWESEALRLLKGYVELLKHDTQLTDPGLRRMAVTHVHDLVALALGGAGDTAEAARTRGLRAARLRAIKADIPTSLGDHGFSVTAVAARNGVTPRYVQALFADEGLTFSQCLMRERLALVHQMLQRAQYAARTTSAIAYAARFGDLSHFNRAFRRNYGATLSDVRAAATRQRE